MVLQDDRQKVAIEDLVVLGRSAPDRMRDNRVTVCVGGWSPVHGFIRIYPSTRRSPLNRWNVVSVPLEKNPQDNRKESWKIQGSKGEWNELHEKIEVIVNIKRNERLKLLQKIPRKKCIVDLINERESLGIIIPSKILEADFKPREKFEKTVQTTLFEDEVPVLTKANYPIYPYIKWECEGPCKTSQGFHETQVIEWGVYEWVRKNPEEKWGQVWENMHLFEEEYMKWFFVGNQFRYPKSFLIISVLRLKIREKGELSLDAFLQ